MLTNILQVAAQATDVVDMTVPNWTPLLIILGIMAFIAILLLIPSKEVKALEDADKKSKPAIKGESEKKALEDKTDKENLSLSEVKEAKRAAVAENMSKEELRELRKERRAATQTEKAIQERSEAQASEEKEDAAEAEEVKAEEVKAEEVKAEEAEEKKEEISLSSADELMADSSADAGDMFASLFGDNNSEGFSLDDDFSVDTVDVDEGTLFPTLGSALIPLSEFTKAAEDPEGSDALEELTKRLSGSAEKKTPE